MNSPVDLPALDAHLLSLGAHPRSAPLDANAWDALGLSADTLPVLARWLLDRYAASTFSTGAVFATRDGVRADIGWVLSATELVEAWDDTRECLPPAMLPLSDDGAGNHVCVDVKTGRVFQHVHDAPRDGRHLVPLADSLGDFLVALAPDTG